MATTDRVVCFCKNLTEQDLLRQAAHLQALELGPLMRATGAGSECMACLLDIELLLGKLDCALAGKRDGLGEIPIRVPRSRRLKRSIYRAVDACFPAAALSARNSFPIVFSETLDTRLTLSNHRLMFSEERPGYGAFAVRVEFHDAEGRLLREESRRLELGQSASFSTRELLAGSRRGQELFVGGGFLTTRPLGRVTLSACRPQIELHSPGGVTTVHMQFTQGRQRYFFLPPQGTGTVNLANVRNVSASEGTCTFSLRDPQHKEWVSYTVTVPGRGSRLIVLDEVFRLSELRHHDEGFLVVATANFLFHINQLSMNRSGQTFAIQH